MMGKLKVKNEKLKVTKIGIFFILTFIFVTPVSVSAIPAADPLFTIDPTALGKQWYLERMQIPEAWGETTGGSVTVAVVDTGIDGKHEDLNDGRVGKGFASYCAKKNAVNPDQCDQRITREILPGENSDDNGHGTVVAGIIGAVPNNNKGITGINWNVRLMPIKVLDANGSGNTSDLASGIKWAADNGARIINLSIGGEGLSGLETIGEAITYAFNKGAVVIASAGNDSAENGTNLNTSPSVPVCADGGLNMVIGVAALDVADKKAKFSNYGSNCIDLSAPGTGTFTDKQQKQGVISTYFDPSTPNEHDLYVYAVGTSVAAPMVSGIAALVLSINPTLDAKSLRDRLLASVDNIDESNKMGCGTGSCAGQIGRGRINAKTAVTTKVPFDNGSLVRDESSTTYLIENGFKRSISTFVLKQRFAALPISTASKEQLAFISTGPAVSPIDTTLVKETDMPTVYVVEEGKLHGLSYLAFISRGFRFQDVVNLPSWEMRSYAKGEDFLVANGALIKTAYNPAVFILNNGNRQLLSYFVFLQRGFNGRTVAVVSDEELQRYPRLPGLYPLPDGTLLRGDQIATVYIVMDGKLRGMNLNAFKNRGYKFKDVKLTSQFEMKFYEYGPDIIE